MINKAVFHKTVFLLLFLFQQNAFTTNTSDNSALKPTGFIENRGQLYNQDLSPNKEIKFLYPIPNLNVALKSTGFSYDTYFTQSGDTAAQKTFQFHRIDVSFINANNNVYFFAEDTASWHLNYYNAVTPEEGINKVRHYKKITYKNLYNNIDLEFIAEPGTDKPVEYNFILHPGASIADIKLRYEGMNSAFLNSDTLELNILYGTLKETIPLSYWLENKKEEEVNYCVLETTDNSITVGFNLTKQKNILSTLIIDPTPSLNWCTYYGATGHDDAGNAETGDVCSDRNNNAIMLSHINIAAAGLVTAGAHQVLFGGGNYDAAITKFDANGNLLWATYYGGAGIDAAYSVEVDNSNNIFIVGLTTSTSGMATAGTHQAAFACGGACNASFIAKFNAAGVRQWSSYFYDNSESMWLTDLALNSQGDVLVCGTVQGSSGVATAGTFKPTYTWTFATVVGCFAKFNGTNGTRVWGSYLTKESYPKGIYCDPSDNVLITGYGSTFITFPGPVINCLNNPSITTVGAHQVNHGGGADAFITKFDPAATTLLWGTYYGGGNGPGTNGAPTGDEDAGRDIICDNTGNIYVSGYTSSKNNISTPGSYQPVHSIAGIGTNGFLVKFDPAGVRQWGTYYPGVLFELAKDSCGNIFAGGTANAGSITSSGAYQLNHAGASDGFIVKFNSAGARSWGTYFGGTGTDDVRGLDISSTGNIYVAGTTYSANLPTTAGAFQTAYGGGGFGNRDAYLASFADTATKPVLLASPNIICPQGTSTITITSGNLNAASNWYWYTGGCGNTLIDSGLTLIANPTVTTTYYARGEGACTSPGQCDSVTITVTSSTATGTASLSICSGDSSLIGGIYRNSPGIYADTLLAASASGCDSIVNITLSVTSAINTSSTIFICQGDTATIHGNPYTSAGVYADTLQSFIGCDSISSITLNIYPSPITGIINLSICSGDSVLINGSYQNTAGTYPDTLLNASATGCDSIVHNVLSVATASTATISPTTCGTYISPGGKTFTSSGIYADTISSTNGCDSIIAINLNIGNNVVNNIVLNNNCDSLLYNGTWYYTSTLLSDTVFGGASTGCDSIINTSIGINYTASYNDSVTICKGTFATIHGTARFVPGIYTQTFSLSSGCDSIAQIKLKLDSLSGVSIYTNTTTVIAGESLTLNASGAPAYLWSTGETSSFINASPATETHYCVTGINTNGCEDSACVTINVKTILCDISELQIPNAFSPNGDGQNDYLCFYGDNECFTSFFVKIYDRWGEKVFESNDKSNCWDGYHKGKKLNSGVFIYHLLSNTSDGESLFKSGNITLVE